MRNNLTESYQLGGNINCSDTLYWNAGQGFEPIGDNVARFEGMLDGQGYRVTNLFIARPNRSYVGLIGYTQWGAMITNNGLEEMDILGGDNVGGFVGHNSGLITMVSATGSVSGTRTGLYAYVCVGGLVGGNLGLITNVTFTGSVSATYEEVSLGGLLGCNFYGSSVIDASASGSVSNVGPYANVGGLVGENYYGSITNAYAMSSVLSESDFGSDVGGLVGENHYGTVINTYTTGSTASVGADTAGGLIGYNNYGSIINSHATGSVSGTSELASVGGLVGKNSDGSVINTYATGSVFAGSYYVGGLVGYNDNGIVTNAYVTGSVFSDGVYVGGLAGWNTGIITNTTAIGSISGNGGNVGGLVGSNTGIISDATAVGSVSSGSNRATIGGLAGWNDGSISYTTAMGSVSGDRNDAHVGGLVGWNDGTIDNTTANGFVSGDGDNSYVGGLVGQNDGIIKNAVANGIVSSDGDETDVGGLVGFNDITGSVTYANATGNVFGRRAVGGLVGQNEGTIRDAVATGQVSGNSNSIYIGGLVGVNHFSGSVISTTATGRVTGNNEVGGLIGLNSGTINHTSAMGDVFGNNAVGGLVGENNGIILYAYSTGLVSGSDDVGGFIGTNSGGSIQNVYAIGGATGENNVGGLIGLITHTSEIAYIYTSGCVYGAQSTNGLIGKWLTPPKLTSVYWDENMMRQSKLSKDMAYLDNALYKKTTEELYRKSTYVNWDFTITWRIHEGMSYPYLNIYPPEVIPVASADPCYSTTDLFKLLLQVLITPMNVGLTLLLVVGFCVREWMQKLTFQSGNLDTSKALPILAKLGQLQAVQVVCEDKTASVHDADVRLALRAAALSGQITIVDYLFDKYPALLDEATQSSIAESAYLRNYPEISDRFVANYNQIQPRFSLTSLQSQLFQILNKHSYPWFSTVWLSMQCISINVLNTDDHTPLMLASEKEQHNTALFLVYFHGADVMMTNRKGETVIDQLIRRGKITQARQLIQIDAKTAEHWRWGFAVVRQLVQNGKMTPVNSSEKLPNNTDRILFPRSTHARLWIALTFILDMLNRLSDLFLIHALRDHEQLELANISLACFLIAYSFDIYGFRTALGYWFIPFDTHGLWQLMMMPVASPSLVSLTWGVELMDLYLAKLKILHLGVEDFSQWVVIALFFHRTHTIPSIIWMKVVTSSAASLLIIVSIIRSIPLLRQEWVKQQHKQRHRSDNAGWDRNSITLKGLLENKE